MNFDDTYTPINPKQTNKVIEPTDIRPVNQKNLTSNINTSNIVDDSYQQDDPFVQLQEEINQQTSEQLDTSEAEMIHNKKNEKNELQLDLSLQNNNTSIIDNDKESAEEVEMDPAPSIENLEKSLTQVEPADCERPVEFLTEKRVKPTEDQIIFPANLNSGNSQDSNSSDIQISDTINPQIVLNTKSSIVPKILLTAGPLFLVASLVISLIIVNSKGSNEQVAESYPVQGIETKDGLTVDEFMELAPYNPNEAMIFNDQNKEVQLASGELQNYDDIFVEFNTPEVVEKNAEIIGYQIYFGTESNPQNVDFINDSIFIKKNLFSTEELGIKFEKNVPYYLMIRTVTNGRAPYGYDHQSVESSKIYFEYIYE